MALPAANPKESLPLSNIQFTDLGLNPALLKALDAEGYTVPTPIQAQAIPSVLAGKDLLGIAQTGTGKTAAFALPILHRLAADPKPAMRRGTRCLVLSPTRELATQIADSFRTYGRHLGLKVTTVFGGVSMRSQIQALNAGVDVVVATPGRLLDHMGERTITLDGTEILVLDEADQMMDLGFIKPLRQIVARLPSRRQSLFFSATMPNEIGSLAAELLRDPVKVSVTPAAKTADRVTQKVIFVEQTKKRALLAELLADNAMSRTLVFTRTKRGADRVARHLETAGIQVAAIHGNKSQSQREQALAAFKASKIRALIATDIAARGIDVDAVSHVVNFDIPNIPESYVHRIGRTARAGAEGIAWSLVDVEERGFLRDIEKLTKQTIPSEDRRGDKTLVVPADAGKVEEEDRPRGDRRGGRPSGGNRNFEGRGERSNGHRGGAGAPSRGGRPSRRDGGRDDARDQRGPAPVSAGAGSRPDRSDRSASERSSRDHNEHRVSGARPIPNHTRSESWSPLDRPLFAEAPQREAPRPDQRPDSRPERRPERRNETRSERPQRADGPGQGPGLSNVRFLKKEPSGQDRNGKSAPHAHRKGARPDDRLKARSVNGSHAGPRGDRGNGSAPRRQRDS